MKTTRIRVVLKSCTIQAADRSVAQPFKAVTYDRITVLNGNKMYAELRCRHVLV